MSNELCPFSLFESGGTEGEWFFAGTAGLAVRVARRDEVRSERIVVGTARN